MRLIIAGSRSIPIGVSMLIIDAAARVHRLRPAEVIVGLAQGPDTAGLFWARQRGIPWREFPALWGKYGNRAGPERNERMALAGTHLLALYDGSSSGTGDMIYRARAHALPLIVLHVEASPATAARIDAERKARRRPLAQAGRRP